MELQLQELDYWAIGVYILLMAGIGLSFGWFIKDVGAYFKGNGTIPWVMATVTNFMGLFSTFVFVAYAGIAYEYGLVSVTVFWSTGMYHWQPVAWRTLAADWLRHSH